MFFFPFLGRKTGLLWYIGQCVQETATLLEGAQLSANRFYCCGITDNPGRFDSKSTQVTRMLRRTDASRKDREEQGETTSWEQGGEKEGED